MKVLWKQRQTVRQVSLSCYCRGGPRSDGDAAKSVTVVQIWWGGWKQGKSRVTLILWHSRNTVRERSGKRSEGWKTQIKGNICSIWFRLWTGPVTGNNLGLRVNGHQEIDSHMSAHRSLCLRKLSKAKGTQPLCSAWDKNDTSSSSPARHLCEITGQSSFL